MLGNAATNARDRTTALSIAVLIALIGGGVSWSAYLTPKEFTQ